jgi:hypothetical protein
MSRLPVLIVAGEDDLHARAVHDVLARRGFGAEWIDFANLSSGVGLTLRLEPEVDASLRTQSGKTITFSEVGTVWWRRALRPRIDLDLGGDERRFVDDEWRHFVDGLEVFAPVRWVNRPSANRLAGLKSVQLVTAQAEGFRVPRTLISNDYEAVQAFFNEGLPLVYKRIGEAPRPLTATKPLLREDLTRLNVLRNCPTIFQERIDAKLDIRVTVIGVHSFATEIESQKGASPLDWRFDHSVPFRQHHLDDDVSERIHTLMSRLGLLYGAIDMRPTPDGEYVFLEVNPSGQYLFVELLAGIPLSQRMAEFLACVE